MKQRVVSDLFCGSTVEKVFAADTSLRGSRRVEKQDKGAAPGLTSVEFDNHDGDWNHTIVLLSPDQQVQSVTVSFCLRFLDELSNGSGGTHRIMNVLLIRSALPAEVPTSTAEIQQVWRAALAKRHRPPSLSPPYSRATPFLLAAE